MPTENPILVEWLRGGEVEAQNRGAWCLWQGGAVVAEAGAAGERCFLRSGAKYLQAAAAVAAGAAGRFGLVDRELALLCASHGGEPAHVETARALLDRGGLDADHLRCGPHLPLHVPSAALLWARGESPTALHNNCSGKHAGMLLAALAQGEPLDGYLEAVHPHQRRIRQVVCDFAEAGSDDVLTCIDGCSAPTFVLPLRAAARAFRNFGSPPPRLGEALVSAAGRLRAAVAAEPFFLAGHDRFRTALVEATRGRVLGKVGAEGFYGAMIPEAEAGLAVHIDDGSSAASERVVVALLRRHGFLYETGVEILAPFVDSVRRNHAGRVVGEVVVRLGR